MLEWKTFFSEKHRVVSFSPQEEKKKLNENTFRRRRLFSFIHGLRPVSSLSTLLCARRIMEACFVQRTFHSFIETGVGKSSFNSLLLVRGLWLPWQKIPPRSRVGRRKQLSKNSRNKFHHSLRRLKIENRVGGRRLEKIFREISGKHRKAGSEQNHFWE